MLVLLERICFCDLEAHFFSFHLLIVGLPLGANVGEKKSDIKGNEQSVVFFFNAMPINRNYYTTKVKLELCI